MSWDLLVVAESACSLMVKGVERMSALKDIESCLKGIEEGARMQKQIAHLMETCGPRSVWPLLSQDEIDKIKARLKEIEEGK